MTDFETRCDILSDLWLEYKHDEQFKDFIDYNDIGLPLAFTVSEGLSTITGKGRLFINETFELFLQSLGIQEDAGYDSLDDLLMGG